MPNNHSSLRSIVSGPLPRVINGEQDLLDLTDMEHVVDTIGPLFQLAPWEIRRCFEELSRKNPHPHVIARQRQKAPSGSSGRKDY